MTNGKLRATNQPLGRYLLLGLLPRNSKNRFWIRKADVSSCPALISDVTCNICHTY